MNQKFTKKQDFVVKQCKKGFKIIKTFTIDLPVLKQEVKITPDKVLETRINHQFGYSFSLLNLDSDPDPEGFPRQDRRCWRIDRRCWAPRRPCKPRLASQSR